MRSPQAIGDDHPCPGITVFHATFSVVLQFSGRPAASDTPVEPGPRNCGHPSTRLLPDCCPASTSLRASCSAAVSTWHQANVNAMSTLRTHGTHPLGTLRTVRTRTHHGLF